MNLLELFLGQDKSIYNMKIVFIYMLILVIAFIICVIVSHKLSIYSPRINKDIQTAVNKGNDIHMQVLDEVAATTEDIRGIVDEQ